MFHDSLKNTFDSHYPKRVSYILTTKDRADFLDNALTQYRKLLGPNDEMIVIDGGSRDRTPEVIEKHKDIVDVFVSEPDVNSFHAQNKGHLLARGKYQKQIGDDEVYHPEAIEKAIQVMEEHSEIDMLICGGTKERNGKTYPICVPSGVGYGKSAEDIFRYSGASGVAHLIRTSSLAKYGFIPVAGGGDIEFVLQFIHRGATVRFCRVNTYHHPVFEHSVTVKNAARTHSILCGLAKKYCSRGFYYQYSITTGLRKYPRLNHAAKRILNVLRRTGIIRENKIAKQKKYAREATVWDGNFS